MHSPVLVYHHFEMRRALSVFLVLLFGLEPFAALLPASAESRLPACCRRHGAHHCAMSAETAAAIANGTLNGEPAFGAPSHCPYFPGYAVATAASDHALAASAVSLPVLLARAHSPAASRAAARESQIRTRASRGPPASLLG
jgi:hypothetical protein